jgi:hypothetical protein
MAKQRHQPINPFVELGGSVWMVINYNYDGTNQPNTLTLERLTAKEVKILAGIANYDECYGILIFAVRKRLGYAKPHLDDSQTKKATKKPSPRHEFFKSVKTQTLFNDWN